MSAFCCKMCGAPLAIAEGKRIVTCEYCGAQQTIPLLDDEKRANLYERASHFRLNNEFDKAAALYELILNEDSTDAEAYWSLVLCRYGVEYVADPASGKRVPTVNRVQYTSIFDDKNYQAALENAEPACRVLYMKEANALNEIQKGYLAISQKEAPFDVFICYKETDDRGRRTMDSVIAGDIYQRLTQEGLKVFYAAITLEDKLGQAYEPYIFAALHSAKVMLVVGTQPQHFSAVWVKNEWSRFLHLIKEDASKLLVPCYRNMDPYTLPQEFSHLQAQDMSKIGFMNDLVRGIKKVISPQAPAPEPAAAPSQTVFIKRAYMALEDNEWQQADQFCEQVLNIDPECAEAYLIKLLAQLHISKPEMLATVTVRYENNSNFQRALRYADPTLRAQLIAYQDAVKRRVSTPEEKKIISKAQLLMATHIIPACNEALDLLRSIPDCADAQELARICENIIEEEESKAKRNSYIAIGIVFALAILVFIMVCASM